MEILSVTLTFTEPLLGGTPLSAKVYTDYLASRRGDENPDNPLTAEELNEELATLPEGDKGVTGFHRAPDGEPIILDYVLKGFVKEACSAMSQITNSESHGFKAYRKKIDHFIHVYPRSIPLVLAGPVTNLSRPLRAETMQGPRVTIATSECAPAGSTLRFEMLSLARNVIDAAMMREWLAYGQFKGLGQWRNASWGRFTVDARVVEVGEFAPSPRALVLA